MMNKRIACYCRISTDRQNTSNQVLELERYVGRHDGWKIVAVYTEQASGADEGRPILAKVIQEAHKGSYDILLVYKTDRLGRSTRHLLDVLTELTMAGVAFASATEAIDTSTAQGRMLLTFLSAVAEFERELIKERIVSGLSRARANGTRLGRPRVGMDIGEAIKLRNAGLGYRRIGKRLGVSHASVYRSLQAVSKTIAAKQPVSVT